ncbi:MAG: TIGR02186 family protein [Pseudomonadota bacterium]
MSMFRTIIAILFSLSAEPLQGADIAVALTDDVVEVDANFSGAQVTVFGAIEAETTDIGKLDLVAVLSGPPGDYTIRPLQRNGLIWLPGAPQNVADIPRFYATVATRPVKDIVPLYDQDQYDIGAEQLHTDEEMLPAGYREAFLEAQRSAGRYSDLVGGVFFVKETLFTIKLELPADTPVGDYTLDVFAYRDGVLLDRDFAMLQVNKVGLERRVYELAHERPRLYGFLCVAVSLLAGWIAGLAFRK